MVPSRRARIAVLAAATAAVVVALFLVGGSGPADPTAGSPPARGGAVTGTGPGPTSTSTTTSTTVPARDPAYRVDHTAFPVAARNRAGSPVTVATTVWYPAGVTGRTFPLILFSPGYQIDPSVYDGLTSAWAAAGYVVAELTYPDTVPGSPQVEYDMVNHPAELSQVLADLTSGGLSAAAPFQRLMDPQEVAVAGQSDGGDVSLAAAAASCCKVAGIKAAVILSGAEAALFGGSYYAAGNPPLLAVQGDRDTINPPGCSAQLYDGAAAPRYYLDLPAATHLSAYSGDGPQLTVVEKVTTAFLDAYTKGMQARVGRLATYGDVAGVSRLITATPVPVSGPCPGAPAGG